MLWAVLRLYPGRLRSWSLEPNTAFPGVLKISTETGREACECVRLGWERAAGRVKYIPLSSSVTSSPRPGVFYMSQKEGEESTGLASSENIIRDHSLLMSVRHMLHLPCSW